MNTQETDIVVNAANAGNFVTLSNALKAAGLVGALKGIGPFTFFAILPPGPTSRWRLMSSTMRVRVEVGLTMIFS